MKILFCNDGSSQAENAVRFGAPIAAAFQAEPTILGIVEKPEEADPLLQSLQKARDILSDHQLEAELITKAGSPVPEIVKRTRESNYDLVVIGAVRKTTRDSFWMSVDTMWMSASAYKIIESIEPPVLVVIGEPPALRRILVCTSGTAYAEGAVTFTGDIAGRINAVVDLLHVMPEPPAMYAGLIRMEEDAERVLASNSRLGRTLRRQKELLEQAGVFGEFRLRHGSVVQEVLKELQRFGYDLVVLGSASAKDMLRQYVMGDITREIVNRAELPVLVLRTGPKQLKRLFSDLLNRLFRPPGGLSGPPN